MQLNTLKNKKGAVSSKKRVGRGIGSGMGKTAGRGHKGQKSRSGVAIRAFEGGQTPLYQRLPRRGFNNKNFTVKYAVLNLGDLQKLVEAKKFKEGDVVSATTVFEKNIIKNIKDGIKILAKGELKTKLKFEVSKVSEKAKLQLEKLGCDVKIIDKVEKPKAVKSSDEKVDKKTKAPKGKKKAAGSKKTTKKAAAKSNKASEKEA